MVGTKPMRRPAARWALRPGLEIGDGGELEHESSYGLYA